MALKGANAAGTITELLGADTLAGMAVSPIETTNEWPTITSAVHDPVGVVTGSVIVQPGITCPGRFGTGTLRSYSWMPPIWASGAAVLSVRWVGHVHVNVLITAEAGETPRIMAATVKSILRMFPIG